MTDALSLFPPTHAAAQERLSAFVPRAGITYARTRNEDRGPSRRDNVSALSPYVKLRMIDEIAMTRAVLSQQDQETAEKFLAEVFWRTYWKGWLELRPGVWRQYQHDLSRLRDDLQTQSGLRQRCEAACTGETGIAAFDTWARELAQTGYLHNHARMWFASIWIFTLDLPWQLGADFFQRNLLDGDAAVNTLSWRWVAGIQTRGKTYLATAENIAANTAGRFPEVTGLATQAVAQPAPEDPPPADLPPCPQPTPSGRYGLLLHGDDIDCDRLMRRYPDPVTLAYAEATAGHTPWEMAPHVATFRQKAARDAAPFGTALDILPSAASILSWAQDNRLDQIIAPYAPVGPMRDLLDQISKDTAAPPLSMDRRPLDSAAWPLATKGFFKFRKNIPDLIDRFVTG